MCVSILSIRRGTHAAVRVFQRPREFYWQRVFQWHTHPGVLYSRGRFVEIRGANRGESNRCTGPIARELRARNEGPAAARSFAPIIFLPSVATPIPRGKTGELSFSFPLPFGDRRASERECLPRGLIYAGTPPVHPPVKYSDNFEEISAGHHFPGRFPLMIYT